MKQAMLLAAVALCVVVGCAMPHSAIWNPAELESLVQRNAARAGITGLVSVAEEGAWRVESFPIERNAGVTRMAVATFAYRRTVNEGQSRYFPVVDSQNHSVPTYFGWFSAATAPGLGEDILSGQSRTTRAGSTVVTTSVTPGAEGVPVVLINKNSPAGNDTYLYKRCR